MNDTEKCAHDLAIAYIQNNPPVVDDDARENEETRMFDYVAKYEEVYSFFKNKINSK